MTQPQAKILCIEDDRETAALIAEELVDRGYEVTLAHDGREGLATILKIMPDLVLSDISMPVMSGFELLDSLIALAPRFSRMPFLFLTALTDRDNELKGRQLGAERTDGGEPFRVGRRPKPVAVQFQVREPIGEAGAD